MAFERVAGRDVCIVKTANGETVSDVVTGRNIEHFPAEALRRVASRKNPAMTVADCFTSGIVRKRLAERGITKEPVIDALLRLRAAGHRRVRVQPTFIIEGKEMAMLRRDVEQVRPFFDDIIVGTPLLYSIDDARNVCSILMARHPANQKKHEHVLFVGHGTEGAATAIYSQLDYMLRDSGHANYHVATIEGYPTLQTAIRIMKEQGARSVRLVPLLYVAGDHATNDIAIEWREALQKEGMTVSVVLEGLEEVDEIQDLILE